MLTLMASSETKVNNTLWTHYQTVRLSGWPFPGAYSSTLISLLELTPELSENPKACLLDKRGITLFFFSVGQLLYWVLNTVFLFAHWIPVEEFF